MLKNNFIRFTVTLFIICVMASALLSFVYSQTKDKIQAQKDLEEQESLKEVLPDASDFDFIEQDTNSYYIGKDDEGKIIGYVFKTEGKGYASDIVTMVGVDVRGVANVIGGIKILSQNETPGLGSKIVEVKQDKTIWSVLLEKESSDKKEVEPKPWFQEQFQGKRIDQLEDVETITGATISSKAVIDSVKNKAKEILEIIQNDR